MTRINCVPPAELVRAHLVAEYRELPRVVGLANAAWGRRPGFDKFLLHQYTMGPGHVRFFYCRMAWVQRRFASLVREMHLRGYRTSFTELPPIRVGPEWMQDWRPTAVDLALSRARIRERLTPKEAQ